ncbi:MAG TPA: universal stress protein [Nocardioidaceae bacterium]|nr:universal stress protein [Nocardioidaceae bacterium]
MTHESSKAAVVVGVDGSGPGRRALVWATGEAVQRDAPLHIVHAFPFDLMVAPEDDPHVRLASQQLLDVAAHARQLAGEAVEVSSALVDGLPARSLTEESRRCALLVLGTRGHGGFANLLLGSTSVHVTTHAACPVVVVPDRETPEQDVPRPVVVGVDASACSERALEFAFDRATTRGSSVHAVQVWQAPTAYGSYAGVHVLDDDADRLEQEAATMLAAAVGPLRERYPRVGVEERVVRGHTVAELAGLSGDAADVVVVGSRGRAALAGMVLGSVSQGLLRHAAGPVVVVR